MPVRLVITTYAKPGQGAELAQAMADRCRAVQQEPGCQQFEVFQGVDSFIAHEFELLDCVPERSELLIIGGSGDQFAKTMAWRLDEY